jgi:hypoxanthine phosphoribosyltransferase
VEEHVQSMVCHRELMAVRSLLIVDDIVTSGSQVIAAASHVQEAYPGSGLKVLALLRTMSQGDVERILEPCSGLITYEGGAYAWREP